MVPFSFFPQLEGERITVAAKLPYGAPIEQTKAVQKELEEAAYRALDSFGDRDTILLGVLSAWDKERKAEQVFLLALT